MGKRKGAKRNGKAETKQAQPPLAPRDETYSQAESLEAALPRLMRGLFAGDAEHPATGLPLAQLRLCRALLPGPRTMSALGQELSTSLSAVTQVADRLERAGLVERTMEAADRRVRVLRLTARGEELMESRRRLRVEHAARVLGRMDPARRAAAVQVLLELVEDDAIREAALEAGGRPVGRSHHDVGPESPVSAAGRRCAGRGCSRASAGTAAPGDHAARDAADPGDPAAARGDAAAAAAVAARCAEPAAHGR